MLAAAVAIAMLIGMAGVVAPFIPGLTVMWLAALGYGVIGGFGPGGWAAFAIITVLFLVGELLGFLLPGRSAAKAGATGASIVLGALCACVGFFVVPVFGFLIGGVLGIYVAEYLRTGNMHLAWETTRSTLVGFGISVLTQLFFGVAIIVTWLAWVVFA
jgi:uncharacterized protein YqgC (DUF456 family)